MMNPPNSGRQRLRETAECVAWSFDIQGSARYEMDHLYHLYIYTFDAGYVCIYVMYVYKYKCHKYTDTHV